MANGNGQCYMEKLSILGYCLMSFQSIERTTNLLSCWNDHLHMRISTWNAPYVWICVLFYVCGNSVGDRYSKFSDFVYRGSILRVRFPWKFGISSLCVLLTNQTNLLLFVFVKESKRRCQINSVVLLLLWL